MKLKMVTGIGGSQQPQQNMVPSSAGIVGGNPSPGDGQKRSSGDHRRSNKPIMEKRRRARINNCLNELKTLILDAMKKDPARHSKLEKADILEMTVKHLENLQRQQVAADPTVVNKFRAGFSECAGEVGRFPGLDPAVKRRLLQHLASCLTGSQVPKQDTAQAQVHILPSPPSSPEHANNSGITGGIFLSNGSGTGVQLMPTRLPNGDIALILPSQSATAITSVPVTVSPLPMLIPIPSRTSSTSSASSSMSSSSSSGDSVCTRIVTTVIRPLTQPILETTPLPSPPICYSPVSPAEREWSPSPDSQRSYSPLPQPSQGRFSPSIDENFRPYSPEQVPLSLVIRRDRPCESEDDKPWRPW